jgi:Niemann-Pick C1 protein
MVATGTLDNGTEVEVKLEDICFKPLAPDNEKCAVMSVLNYFQNNLTRLMQTTSFGLVNNSYHIEYCTRFVLF